ncbi:MAG: hypothetical protein H6712_32240 [Myxococcales bacterium]|nr:hypothetical protein [Myxococcales bacterium]MCB9718565.1 hypothetical protein [Myxococcales bacterium]
MRLALACSGILLSGCMLQEPLPTPLELELDEDEPIPVQPVIDSEQRDAERRTRLQSRLSMVQELREDERLCPPVSYPALDLPLHAGPTFDRIAAALPSPVHSIALADHPVQLPGVRYFQVSMAGGACMLSWWSTGCFVDDAHVHCATPESTDALQAFVLDHGLAEHPDRLSDEGWLHLVATLVGASRMLATPERRATCIDGLPAAVAPRVRTRISRSTDHLSLAVPLHMASSSMVRGDMISVVLEIDEGEVETWSSMLWSVQEQDVF